MYGVILRANFEEHVQHRSTHKNANMSRINPKINANQKLPQQPSPITENEVKHMSKEAMIAATHAHVFGSLILISEHFSVVWSPFMVAICAVVT